MSGFRPRPASTAWMLIGLVALVLLLTGTILPRLLSAIVFAIAVVAYLRSGTGREGAERGGDERPRTPHAD
ncbi:hypothetical protein AA0Z99_13200 [Agrococcus sp. 1P02AA]|uniref:hypothetical protein n=1 Tax=Agrococcus sp. 1P02AA TaxID=3132259 RepID=UPI0039A5147A